MESQGQRKGSDTSGLTKPKRLPPNVSCADPQATTISCNKYVITLGNKAEDHNLKTYNQQRISFRQGEKKPNQKINDAEIYLQGNTGLVGIREIV